MAERASGNEVAIVMPKLGLTMSEGLLAEWLVAPGDDVDAGQILFVVETDKISNEVEAPAPGRIVALLVEAGATVDVGTPVAMWTGPGNVGAPPMQVAPAEMPAAPAPAAEAGPHANGVGRIRSTPFARRLAKLDGIEIAQVPGSGPRGRVQARDVKAAIDARGVTHARQVPASGRDLRPLIAARVTRSKAEIPHFHVTADAKFDALNALRRDLNADPHAPRAEAPAPLRSARRRERCSTG